MLIIWVLWRWRQEEPVSKVNLGYIVNSRPPRAWEKKKQINKWGQEKKSLFCFISSQRNNWKIRFSSKYIPCLGTSPFRPQLASRIFEHHLHPTLNKRTEILTLWLLLLLESMSWAPGQQRTDEETQNVCILIKLWDAKMTWEERVEIWSKHLRSQMWNSFLPPASFNNLTLGPVGWLWVRMK